MNKKQITKHYSIILICLTLVSSLIMFLTPFTIAFRIDLDIFSVSETGLEHIFNTLDIEEQDNTNNPSTNLPIDENITFIEGDVEKWVMFGLLIAIFAYAVLNFFKALSFFSDTNKKSVINQSLSIIKTGLGFNISYFVFCVYIIFKAYEWNFEYIFSGEEIIITQTYVPMIFQIIVFAVAMFMYSHWHNALSGKVAPLKLDMDFLVQLFSQNKQKNNQSDIFSQEHQRESENLELIKKYKELYDTGAITEEEFNEKKKQLLSPPSEDDVESKTPKKEQHVVEDIEDDNYFSTEKETVTYGMKWYKFLIYFALFASAIVNVLSAISHLTGSQYGTDSKLVYSAFPNLRALDVLFGMVFVGLAILSLVTRNALYWNKKKGPKLLCAIYAINAVINIVYPLIVSTIIETPLMDSSIWTSSIIGFAMVIINYFYFKKRKDLFKY